MQAFALPPRLTTRYTAKSWERRKTALAAKILKWEKDQKKRPQRVPKKAVCWTTVAVESAGQHAAYLYVVPSKKGGFLLRSKYQHDPRTYPLRVPNPPEDEDTPYAQMGARTVEGCKEAAQSLLDLILMERKTRRKRLEKDRAKDPKWGRKMPHYDPRTDDAAGPSRRDRYLQEIRGLEAVIGVDPDQVPRGEKEFEDWWNARAFGSAGRAKTVTAVDGSKVEVRKGKDRFGMRVGSKAARVNAVIDGKPRSADAIRKLSKEAHVSGHLAKLVELKLVKVKVGKKTGKKLYYDPKIK